jgi:phage baseplate assembly protein W
MPLERVSQGFRDISMTFQNNPLNSDLIVLKNETAIARSIRNIVFTLPGEKFFNPNFGSRVSRSLFENVDEISASNIRDEIATSIVNYESRVNLRSVDVIPDYDNNSLDVTIIYNIVGIDIPSTAIRVRFATNKINAISKFFKSRFRSDKN